MTNELDRLLELEHLADRGLNDRTEFGGVGALLAGAQHVAGNIITKNAMKPGTRANKAAAAVFRKGVRDQKAGTHVRGSIMGASETALGPELAKTYEAGLKSTRPQRYIASRLDDVSGQQAAVRDIMSTRGSGRVGKVLDKLPQGGNYARGQKVGRVAGAAGTIAMDPLTGWAPAALNTGKTAMADSVMRGGVGARVTRRIAEKGATDGPMTGVKRAVMDTAISPTANIIRDAGASAGKGAMGVSTPLRAMAMQQHKLRMALRTGTIDGRQLTKKERREIGRLLIEHGNYRPRNLG